MHKRKHVVSISRVFLPTLLFFLLCVSFLFPALASPGAHEYDYVDNNTSNIDGAADIGTHSNFTAQQNGPHSIFDTLTEANTAGTSTDKPVQNMNFTSDTSGWNFVIVSGKDFAGGWDNTGQTGGSAYIDATTRNEIGEAYWNQNFSFAYSSSLQSVHLSFKWKVEAYHIVDSGAAKLIIIHPNGTSFDVWSQTLTGTTAWSALQYTDVTNYLDTTGTYSLRLDLVADLGNSVTAKLKIYYDDVGVAATYQQTNYELDLEVQWTNATYNLPYKELCIFGGNMGSENIQVDVWTGSTWQNLFSDLSTGWNNVSVTDYLVSSTFTTRFKGGTET
ncbi:hypothetical protein KAU92_05450, partial [Candidatus Bathyarchaeota archaeon]|nr:hypothetical protein [Candidatus Bathyarchaeota archaeon]